MIEAKTKGQATQCSLAQKKKGKVKVVSSVFKRKAKRLLKKSDFEMQSNV